MKHKHAENMLAYAQDAMETETPWERWERRYKGDDHWESLKYCPTWIPLAEYRRKPRTIIINGFEVPEPVREPLEYGQEYYIPTIAGDHRVAALFMWYNNDHDSRWLEKGLIHLTKDAAETHAKALLSFTITQP
jgi:hypothetical protein